MDSMLPSPSIGYTIFIFILVITVLVFVHEMGHFLVARFFKTKVDAFSIGFGSEILGWTDKHGTRWKIAPFPVGGYVKFAGDANVASTASIVDDSLSDAEKAALFQNKPLYQRALITAAGPFVNFLFAIVVFAGLFMTYGQPYSPPVVATVSEGRPAQAAGFLVGDRLTVMNGIPIETFEQVVSYVSVRPLVPIDISIDRNGQVLTLTVTPDLKREIDNFGNEFERGLVGLGSGKPASKQRGPVESFYYATVATIDQTKGMLSGLWQIISGRISVDQLSGPVRIAKLSGEVASVSALSLVKFMAFISISLGLVNLFPIPMLDGGHLVFYAYEALRRRPLPARLQEGAMYIGLLTVVGWSVFVTWNDLKALKVWESLSKLVS